MKNSIKDVRFFSGGKSIFTVGNNQGQHFTYKIRQPKGKDVFFINLLTGPDNTTSYTYLGIYNPSNQTVVTTAKSKFTKDSLPVKVLTWAINTVKMNKQLPKGYSIQHEGRCCRCGRLLTVPESIENGIGPECASRNTW